MQEKEQEFSFKGLFVPLTTLKAIHIIIIAGLIVYFNSLFGNFIGDDFGQIVDNMSIHSARGIVESFTGGSFDAGGQSVGIYYKPLLKLSYTFIFMLFGPTPFFFHLFQLLIHISNAILLYLISKKLFKNVIAFAVAFVFLVHPLNVEPVVYIADLQDVLFLFFGLLSLYLLMFLKENQRYIILIYLCLFLSLLSKETGILFLVITTCYLWLFKKQRILKHIAFTAIVISSYAFLRIVVAHISVRESPITPIVQASMQIKFINMPLIMSYYLDNFFYPNRLLFNQSWVITSTNFQNFYLPLLEVFIFLSALFIIGAWIWKKHREQLKLFGFFSIWLLSGLLIHLHFLPLDVTVSDRWFYFPMVGFLGIIGLAIFSMKIKSSSIHFFVLAFLVIVFALATRTIIRNSNWIDGLTLLSHDIKYVKNDDYLMESSYGSELMTAGQDEKAFPHLAKAVNIYPNNWTTWNNLAALYVKKGKIADAKYAYTQSIKNGNYFRAYENLAFLLLKYDDSKKAKTFIENARLHYPRSIRLMTALLIAQYKTGDHEGALQSANLLYMQTQQEEFYNIYVKLQQKLPIDFPLP